MYRRLGLQCAAMALSTCPWGLVLPVPVGDEGGHNETLTGLTGWRLRRSARLPRGYRPGWSACDGPRGAGGEGRRRADRGRHTRRGMRAMSPGSARPTATARPRSLGPRREGRHPMLIGRLRRCPVYPECWARAPGSQRPARSERQLRRTRPSRRLQRPRRRHDPSLKGASSSLPRPWSGRPNRRPTRRRRSAPLRHDESGR